MLLTRGCQYARLFKASNGDYTDWADERDRTEQEIATNIAKTLEDVMMKLTCLAQNLRTHSNPRGLGPMLDRTLAESSLTSSVKLWYRNALSL